MPKKTEAIQNFLNDFALRDLADLYNHNMEVQVNVAQDDGERATNEGYQGRASYSYVKGEERWYPLRIPKKASTEPEYTDTELRYDLSKHAEAVGMTGWDWVNKVSKWVAFDFDSIAGHAEGHVAKLTGKELQDVEDAASKIPWVTVRKSSGGEGLHLYVFLNDFPTENHTEHAAVGRAILGLMSAESRFDFSIKVDACGGNMWVWHRKAKDTDGFALVKQGEILEDVPLSWRDHLAVVTRRRTRTVPSNVKEDDIDMFDRVTGQRPVSKLDSDHAKLFDYLKKVEASWWWDADRHMLVCHTFDLKNAHKDLGFRGSFDTVATGRHQGGDWNCFAFPCTSPFGSWSVRRYAQGVAEAPNWTQDSSGWTQCFLNSDPTLKDAVRIYGGVEDEKGNFHFSEAETANGAANLLGLDLGLPRWASGRSTTIKTHKDGRLIAHVKRESNDDQTAMAGWHEERGKWKKIFDVRTTATKDDITSNFDDSVRHVVSQAGKDSGWLIQSGVGWNAEPLPHVKLVLQSRGLTPKELTQALGTSVDIPWSLVNEPFKDEHPGGRKWNRDCAQLAYTPDVEGPYHHPTWNKVLRHCGLGIDSAVGTNQWCRESGILTGEDYLRTWVASMFQFPSRPLPYLFLYSQEERTGKSTLHESLRLLMNRHGYQRADNALTSPGNFNGELAGAVLCVIEETDLSASKTARNRLKDWVTGDLFPVHIKNLTPYLVDNTAHFIQSANAPKECPIFPGDTRITMIRVPALKAGEFINRDKLQDSLSREAPAFLGSLLSMDIPTSNDRLNIPIVESDDKRQAAKCNRTELEIFIEEECYWAPGESIRYAEFWARFQEWLSVDSVHNWSKVKMGRDLPTRFPKGRIMQDGSQFNIGNISFTKPESTDGTIYVLRRDTLKKENEQ